MTYFLFYDNSAIEEDLNKCMHVTYTIKAAYAQIGNGVEQYCFTCPRKEK